MLGHPAKALCAVALAASLSGVAATASAAPQTRQRDRTTATRNSKASSEVEQLRDLADEVGRSIRDVRSRDPQLADRLAERLDTLRDDVTYLRVKARRGDRVSNDEIVNTRGQLEQLRAEALGEAPPEYGPDNRQPDWRPRGTTGNDRDDRGEYREHEGPARQGRSTRMDEVPEGTELDVRLETPLSSETARVEDPFEATTVVDLDNGNSVVVPAGSVVRGVVAAVNKAGRLDRKGRLTLQIDRLTVNGRTYPIRATMTQALESEGYRGDAGKIGAGAGVGAIIGGILGGVRGALAGILIGGGGVVAATEGQDVDLPAGTILRIRMDEPVTVSRR